MTTVRKRALFWWVGGVLILVIAVGAIWWITAQQPKSTPQKQDEQQLAWSERDKKVNEYKANNDTDGGMKYYNQLVQQSSDTATKRTLLLEQSNFSFSAKQYDTALRLADQAEAIKPGVDVVTQRALIYEAMGDKSKAAAQYRQAIEMTKDLNSGQGDRYAPVWRAKIEELEK